MGDQRGGGCGGFCGACRLFGQNAESGGTFAEDNHRNIEGRTKTIDELGSDVRQVVRQANELTSDIQHKMKQIDPLMESVKHAGEVLSEVTLATKQVSAALASRIASRPLSVKRKAPASPAPATSVPSAQPLQAEGEQPVQEANRKPANWVKWVDVAADVWQKYRS